MSRIDYQHWVPMIPAQFGEPVLQNKMETDTSVKTSTKDTVFLENRKEIKPNTIPEKGIFVDIYV